MNKLIEQKEIFIKQRDLLNAYPLNEELRIEIHTVESIIKDLEERILNNNDSEES